MEGRERERERERDCGKEYGNGLLRRLESQQQPALGSSTVLVIADYLGIWMLVCVYFGNNVLFAVGWLYGYGEGHMRFLHLCIVTGVYLLCMNWGLWNYFTNLIVWLGCPTQQWPDQLEFIQPMSKTKVQQHHFTLPM